MDAIGTYLIGKPQTGIDPGSVANFSVTVNWHTWLSIRSHFMFKGRHFDQSVILLRIRWYLAHWKK